MTLSAHAIVGASIASIIPSHPVLGFVTGFASHFLLDAIPHWDYFLFSRKEDNDDEMNNDMIMNKYLILDLLRVSSDAIIGVIIVLFLFGISDRHLIWAPLLGMIGGMAPDALQFVYFKWRHEPMISLQRFHLWIHSKKRLDNRPI